MLESTRSTCLPERNHVASKVASLRGAVQVFELRGLVESKLSERRADDFPPSAPRSRG